MSADQVRRDLRNLAAHYQLGGLINDVDEIGQRYGGADALPSDTFDAVISLRLMLDELGLADARNPQVADVWRSR